MTWPLPPLHAPSLASLLAREGAAVDLPSLAAAGALLGSQDVTAEDDRLPLRHLDEDTVQELLRQVAHRMPPPLRDSLPRVVRAAFERVEPWLDIRRRQGLHRAILGSAGELCLRGRGHGLELSREPGRVRADPLEELAMLTVAVERAGSWAGAEALVGGWLAQELDPRAVMLLPLLKVVAVLRLLQESTEPVLASPGGAAVLLRHAWSQLCAPARRPRVLLITGSSTGMRSGVGHALLSRLRGALLLELEADAPEGEWQGRLAGALADLQVVILAAPVRPAALDRTLQALLCRCDAFALVGGASPFPEPVADGERRMEAQLPEEVLATAVLASIR